MQKREFIDRISAKTGLMKKDSERIMDALFETLQEILSEGGWLMVNGCLLYTSPPVSSLRSYEGRTIPYGNSYIIIHFNSSHWGMQVKSFPMIGGTAAVIEVVSYPLIFAVTVTESKVSRPALETWTTMPLRVGVAETPTRFIPGVRISTSVGSTTSRSIMEESSWSGQLGVPTKWSGVGRLCSVE